MDDPYWTSRKNILEPIEYKICTKSSTKNVNEI